MIVLIVDVKDRLLKANHNMNNNMCPPEFDVKDRLLKANHNWFNREDLR